MEGAIVGQLNGRRYRNFHRKCERRRIEIDGSDVRLRIRLDVFLLDGILERFVDQVVGRFFEEGFAPEIVFDNETRRLSFAKSRNVVLLRHPARRTIQRLLDLFFIEFDGQFENTARLLFGCNLHRHHSRGLEKVKQFLSIIARRNVCATARDGAGS